MQSRTLNLFPGCALVCAVMVAGIFSPTSLAAVETNTVHIALVFDDGPFPDPPPKLLELFAREGIHVTFSLVASNVVAHPETARAIVAAGHEVANHSFGHQHPKTLSDAELEHEIVAAQKVIAEKSGFTPRWYWPPFVETDDRVRAMAGTLVRPLRSTAMPRPMQRPLPRSHSTFGTMPLATRTRSAASNSPVFSHTASTCPSPSTSTASQPVRTSTPRARNRSARRRPASASTICESRCGEAATTVTRRPRARKASAACRPTLPPPRTMAWVLWWGGPPGPRPTPPSACSC